VPVESAADRASIFAVIVLYKQRPSASVTVATLRGARSKRRVPGARSLSMDNSADTEAAKDALPAGFHYQAAAVNRGLLGAYEAALDRSAGGRLRLAADADQEPQRCRRTSFLQ